MSKPELFSATFTFTQEGDSCDVSSAQQIDVTIDDAGGGHFFTVKTNRWSTDESTDMGDLLAELRIRLGDWWRAE